MSTRRLSSRIASSPAKYAAVTSLNAGIATEAPRVKRRRKDTPSSLHNDDAVLPTKPDCDSSNSDKSGDVQRASSIGGGDKDGGGMRSPSTSVVMVQVPEGFSFAHAACSYGYYLVPPNRWEPCKDNPDDRDAGTFTRPLRFGERLAKTARCIISQVAAEAEGGGAGKATFLRVDVAAAAGLTLPEEEDIRSQVARMFQTTIDLKPWFSLSPEAERRSYGRLFRSPTLFEDMVKSITGCNMKFQGTIRMNKLLCEEFGHNEAFPTPEDLEGVLAEDLKERAKVGYRGDRILRLAQSFRDGSVDPHWLEAPERSRDEVLKFVKNLYGFGDYAAGNVAMLLGFYNEIPLDSETVRHFKDYHGVTTKNVKEVSPKVKQQYKPYAPYQFLQYWYEMIVWHEKKRGLEVHLWDARDFSY